MRKRAPSAGRLACGASASAGDGGVVGNAPPLGEGGVGVQAVPDGAGVGAHGEAELLVARQWPCAERGECNRGAMILGFTDLPQPLPRTPR